MKKKHEEVSELPHFIDVATWNDFVEMRISIKKKMTPGAIKRIIKKLVEFNNLGMFVNAILDQSIINNWMDVYPLRNEIFYGKNNKGKSNPINEINDYINKAMAEAKAKNGLIDIN